MYTCTHVFTHRDTDTRTHTHRHKRADDYLFLAELEADTVDAVSLVGGRRVALALEDVAEVGAARGARDLRAHAATTMVRLAVDSACQTGGGM